MLWKMCLEVKYHLLILSVVSCQVFPCLVGSQLASLRLKVLTVALSGETWATAIQLSIHPNSILECFLPCGRTTYWGGTLTYAIWLQRGGETQYSDICPQTQSERRRNRHLLQNRPPTHIRTAEPQSPRRTVTLAHPSRLRPSNPSAAVRDIMAQWR